MLLGTTYAKSCCSPKSRFRASPVIFLPFWRFSFSFCSSIAVIVKIKFSLYHSLAPFQPLIQTVPRWTKVMASAIIIQLMQFTLTCSLVTLSSTIPKHVDHFTPLLLRSGPHFALFLRIQVRLELALLIYAPHQLTTKKKFFIFLSIFYCIVFCTLCFLLRFHIGISQLITTYTDYCPFCVKFCASCAGLWLLAFLVVVFVHPCFGLFIP